MPDQDGKMNAAENERAIAWFREKVPSGKCPLCGNSNWSIADRIAAVHSFMTSDGVAMGVPRIIPLVLFTCTNCANTVGINAATAGIVIRNEEKSDATK